MNLRDKPPDDFTKLNIIPTKEDLQEMNPFLRAMPVEGKFTDAKDHLDCVFRLLREDAFIPLRQGVALLQ